MVRRSFRRGLRLGLLVGAIVAVAKVVQSRRGAEPPAYVTPPSPWPVVDRSTSKPAPEPVMEAATFVEAPAVVAPAPEAEPDPAPTPTPAATKPRRERPLKAAPAPKNRAPKPAAGERIWVEPSGTVCPPTHPIKAKLASMLFHLPGMFAYDRCKPDRCYATEPGAVADGLQKAKR